MAAASKDIVIRAAQAEDAATVHALIEDLAAYEDLRDAVRASPADIRRDGFGSPAYFECLLVELGGAAVGMALYFFTYSTFEGRPSLYLEDLFLAERARGIGLGQRLMARLAAVASERNCARLDLSVLDWNPTREFYHRLGFRQVDDWLAYRLEGEALERLAEQDRR